MCVEGSSPNFPLNFGISEEGSLEDMVGHDRSWKIGSSVNHDKFGRSNVARKGNGANEY
jgi:hypothetical protein